MRVLALDTATLVCSVALDLGGEIIERRMQGGRGHADRILVLVDEVLAQAGLKLTELDGIAASIGPGTFTGVRISVAVSQGLAFGAGLPVIPVSTLEALASDALARAAIGEAPTPSAALACLDARMGEVYWGCFAPDARRGVEALGAAQVSAPGAVALPAGRRTRGIGAGFGAYPELAALPGLTIDAAATHALPDARAMARLGRLRLAAGEGVLDPALLEPEYLRDRVAFTEAERAAAHRS